MGALADGPRSGREVAEVVHVAVPHVTFAFAYKRAYQKLHMLAERGQVAREGERGALRWRLRSDSNGDSDEGAGS